jgi:inorganic pyrophosphatase
MNLLKDIPPGDDPPNILNVVIEVISGSRYKYEYNFEWEAFVLDRVVHSSVVFPVEYGFVPQSWYNDQDPLDVLIMSYEPLEVGCIVKVRPIGAIILEDEKGEDPKILSVPIGDPRFNEFRDIKDVPNHILKEIQEFFLTYKRLEPRKWVKFKEWKNAKEAKEIINYSLNLYKNEFKKRK